MKRYAVAVKECKNGWEIDGMYRMDREEDELLEGYIKFTSDKPVACAIEYGHGQSELMWFDCMSTACSLIETYFPHMVVKETYIENPPFISTISYGTRTYPGLVYIMPPDFFDEAKTFDIIPPPLRREILVPHKDFIPPVPAHLNLLETIDYAFNAAFSIGFEHNHENILDSFVYSDDPYDAWERSIIPSLDPAPLIADLKRWELLLREKRFNRTETIRFRQDITERGVKQFVSFHPEFQIHWEHVVNAKAAFVLLMMLENGYLTSPEPTNNCFSTWIPDMDSEQSEVVQSELGQYEVVALSSLLEDTVL